MQYDKTVTQYIQAALTLRNVRLHSKPPQNTDASKLGFLPPGQSRSLKACVQISDDTQKSVI